MTKEVKVGIFAVISGAIFYFGFNYLKGIDFFSPTHKYYAIYDNIDGLNVSNPVIVNGFSVGRVSRIQILQHRDNDVLVELDVDENIVLGDSTVATLMNSDFLGSKAILLNIGSLSNPIEDGDTLISSIDKGLAALLESAQPITANLDVTIRRINEILLGMEGAGDEIKATIVTMNETLKGVNIFIRQNNVKVKATFDNVNALLANINTKVDKLDPILANADQTLDKVNQLELDSTLANLNKNLDALNIMLNDINEGKGTVGKLLKEDSLYNSMNKMIQDLDQLIIHFDENPKHFLGPLGKSKKKIERDRAKAAGN